MGEPEGQTPLGKPRLRKVYNINMNLGWESLDWIDMAMVGTSGGILGNW